MKCLKENFLKDLHSGDLNFTAIEGSTIDEILTNIETALEDMPFSVSLDSSKDIDTYQDSIKSLVETILQKLEERDLPFELNRSAKGLIRKYLNSKLLPKPLTKTELSIQAVIAGTDLITEDERRSLRLSQTLREIYSGNDAINAFRQSQFDEEMRVRTIIDIASRRIIDTQDDLNEGIMKYQSEQFKIIRDFLKNQGFDLSEVPQSLYKSIKKGNSEEGIKTLQRNYTNALQMMYNFILKKKLDGTLSSMLELGWENKIFRNEGTDFYDAVSAYVNLSYFDDILKECFGDYISINSDLDQAIVAEPDGFGGTNVIYKYAFEKGNVNAVKTWGVEEHDALKEMSKFQQILIRSIPIYNYESRSIETGRLQPKDFVGSFSKLLDVGALVVNDQQFRDAINSFHDHPTLSTEIIFKRLFENRSNATLLNELEKLGLDSNNINFLYSVYKTVFKGKDSWKSVEEDYIKQNGLTSRYILIDTLLGVMDSNVSMNYAQTTYNHDTGSVETSVKARYSANRTKFDIVNNVNPLTIDRQNKQEILDRFGISTKNKKDYIVTLNIGGEKIEFKISPKNNKGILDKGITSSLDISNLPKLSEIDLSSDTSRFRLISGQNLNDDERKLLAVLDFIDTMLDTTFSRDVDSLKELNLLLRVNKANLAEMFASASRALLVTDIYNKFENAIKKDGSKYSKTELLQFLEDLDIYADKIQSYGDKKKKEYFIQRYDGYQLSAVRPTQRWIEDLARVRAILSGDTSKSVIANLDGDKVPNFGPGYLGAKLEQQLTQSRNALKASSHLLFVVNPAAVKAKVVNTDVITKEGLKKLIKNMTEGELLYDAIVNKFIVPYLHDKSMYTQPTTFSDKTKFILYLVSLSTLGIDSLVGNNFNSTIEQKIIDTIGKAYKEVYQLVLDDYARIFPEFVLDGKVNLDQVQNYLKNAKEADFTKKALQAGVSIYKDVHYRQISGKKLSINELLYEYANNLFTSKKLHERLEKEKLNFINDLLSKRLSFEVTWDEKRGGLDGFSGNEMTKFIVKLLGQDLAESWVRGNKLILAKIRNTKTGKVRSITLGHITLLDNEEFIINPILNSFFMLDNLVGNNLRFSLTGSEINHKVKALAKLDLGKAGLNLFKNELQKLNPNYDGGVISFYEVSKALENYETSQIIAQLDLDFEAADPMEAAGIGLAIAELSKDLPAGFSLEGITEDVIKRIRNIYETQIYKIENGAQNALFKRNVIIPGTMRYYLQGRLNGIRDKMKVAVINDLGADVFNFDGVKGGVDAHDGSALVNPFSSILENYSLQDCEVGTVKKPIQHWYDDRYMSATLLKYAIDTITNQWMRQSEGNQTSTNPKHGIVLRNVFKKMTNVRWHNPDGSWKFGEIDLIGGCEFRDNPKIDFFTHILEKKPLYYRDGIEHRKIHDFGIDSGVYYTIEYDVDSIGQYPEGVTPKKIYHYFQNDGTHVRSERFLEDPGLHTIDSLFELHTALGGIYSESLDEEGNLQYSEASNYAVAQFINNVASLKKDADPDNLTQESYYLPLKLAMIDVLANNSAVKNGAGNMNPTSSFYDDAEFSYIEIGTNGYGIQMDADHTADEGHMTEFSQVISSLDAGGRLHGYVSLIYETLGKLALDLSEVELSAIEEFRNTGNLSDVYDVVGRTIMNNLSKDRGQAGLANAIIDAIKEKFNLNTDHSLDEFKIPFSDPNIYSTILSTFVSVINKKSIKRQYPGLGTVMVPGYDISMIYDVDGNTYQYEDLIKMAYEAGFTSAETDLSKKNKDIVQQFLQTKLNELPIYSNQETFLPTDNVRISYNSEVSGTGMIEVSLNSIDDYYLFKDNIVAFLNGKGIVNPTNISFQKNIMVPRNLAPVRISWEYDEIVELVPKAGNITIQLLISPDGTINWNTFEETLNTYHNGLPDSRFAKGRYTLATREEKHFEGEKNTLNHIKFVTQSMLDLIDGKFDNELPFVSEARANLANQKDLLILAAMFHDVAKPFRHGDIHGWESADILREIVGTNYDNRLAEWAVRHHMPMPFSHKAEFNLDNPDAISVAENIARDALRLGIDKATAINAFVLINAADIINSRELSVEDNWAKKELIATGKSRYGEDISVKNVLTKELEEKVKLLSKAFENVSKENFGDTKYNYYNQEAFDYRAYPEGGNRIPFLRTVSRSMNIFDHWAIKAAYTGKRDVEAIQKAFDDLEKGIYIDENGVSHKIRNLLNKAAELIMSNLYKTKFGLRNGDSLADVMREGVNYFKRPVTPIMSDSYDIVYTKLDNRNLYITFKPLQQNSENFDSTRRSWKNRIPKKFTYPENYTGPRNIINRIYAATNDNVPLFEVGREILVEGVQYDKTKKKFVDSTGKVLANQSSYRRYGEDRVLLYIEFITNNLVTEIGEKTFKYDLYNINRDAIKKILVRQEYTQEQLTRRDKNTGETYTITADLKFDEEVNNFISHLLADIYHTRDFNGMLVNQQVSLSSAYILQHTLYGLGEQLKYDADLSGYVRNLLDLVNSGKAEDGIVKYSNRIKNRILNQYHEKLAKKQYTSFLKSQEFTVSRIPAQTLQSFMQMKNVGFTGTPTNQCFVSHWQTW